MEVHNAIAPLGNGDDTIETTGSTVAMGRPTILDHDVRPSSTISAHHMGRTWTKHGQTLIAWTVSHHTDRCASYGLFSHHAVWASHVMRSYDHCDSNVVRVAPRGTPGPCGATRAMRRHVAGIHGMRWSRGRGRTRTRNRGEPGTDRRTGWNGEGWF